MHFLQDPLCDNNIICNNIPSIADDISIPIHVCPQSSNTLPLSPEPHPRSKRKWGSSSGKASNSIARSDIWTWISIIRELVTDREKTHMNHSSNTDAHMTGSVYDKELYLLLGVFSCLIFIVKLQWQYKRALNNKLYRITFNKLFKNTCDHQT
jgi:hypothetical protein